MNHVQRGKHAREGYHPQSAGIIIRAMAAGMVSAILNPLLGKNYPKRRNRLWINQKTKAWIVERLLKLPE
jgi:hypothetical protein